MLSAETPNGLPEPYSTQSSVYIAAILKAPTRHRLFEALDSGLNFLRELKALQVLDADETLRLGSLWGDVANKRLRALPESGDPESTLMSAESTVEMALDTLTQSSLEHLVTLAERDLEQSCKVANFLLAWWSASENGGFDLADLYSLNQESAIACSVVFSWVAQHGAIPHALGYEARFKALALKWRLHE